MGNLTAWLQGCWDSLFPVRCPACGCYADGSWCSRCLARIVKMRRLPLGAHNQLNECWAAALYSGVVRELLKGIKYQKQRAKCRYLTDLLVRADFDISRYDIIVPIPLHAVRQQQRGYNQTAEIFKPWADSKNVLWQQCLLRIKATKPQYSLPLAERRQNMRGAFILTNSELLPGKRVLVVDDIYTSGATLHEAAYILKKAGARQVSALVLASDAD